jgi:hypothetical protein
MLVGVKNSGLLAWGGFPGKRAGKSGQKIKQCKQFGVKLNSWDHF